MIFTIFVFIIMIIIVLATFIFNILKSHANNTQTELEELEGKIQQKITELENINQHIEQQSIDTSVNLTQMQIKILDGYEHSNIRIPKDIIEDLSTTWVNLTEEETYQYIESQRQYWKLENTKKPFKRVGKIS